MDRPKRRGPRVGPLRLAFWGFCIAVAAVLVFQGDGLCTRPTTLAPQVPAGPDGAGNPGATGRLVRFGALGHASQLVVLWGLSTELCYPAAAQNSGFDGLRIDLFESADQAAAALSAGALDVACLPARQAVALFDAARNPTFRIVAGAGTGGELFVASKDLTALPIGDLEGTRVALVAAPVLDIAAVLGIGGDRAPEVLLLEPDAVAAALAQGRADFAVLPEPLASTAALASGARLLSADAVPGGDLASASVLVATTEFLAAEPRTVSLLLQQHELAAHVVAEDPEAAIAAASRLIERAGRNPPPRLAWSDAIRDVRFGTDPPAAELRRLLALASGGDGVDADAESVDARYARLVDAAPLEAARRDVAEIVGER